MKPALKITLKPNEKVYINGAVVQFDRKVQIEFLNDVQFLLEQHVLQADDAKTPLRQLYFILQLMLMTPENAGDARAMFRRSLPLLVSCFSDEAVLQSLRRVEALVEDNAIYEALKILRGLYKAEERILSAPAGPRRDLVPSVPVVQPLALGA